MKFLLSPLYLIKYNLRRRIPDIKGNREVIYVI